MLSVEAQMPQGYLHAVIGDALRPFAYRSGLRTLLGLPDSEIGMARAALQVPPVGFVYARWPLSGKFKTRTQPPVAIDSWPAADEAWAVDWPSDLAGTYDITPAAECLPASLIKPYPDGATGQKVQRAEISAADPETVRVQQPATDPTVTRAKQTAPVLESTPDAQQLTAVARSMPSSTVLRPLRETTLPAGPAAPLAADVEKASSRSGNQPDQRSIRNPVHSQAGHARRASEPAIAGDHEPDLAIPAMPFSATRPAAMEATVIAVPAVSIQPFVAPVLRPILLTEPGTATETAQQTVAESADAEPRPAGTVPATYQAKEVQPTSEPAIASDHEFDLTPSATSSSATRPVAMEATVIAVPAVSIQPFVAPVLRPMLLTEPGSLTEPVEQAVANPARQEVSSTLSAYQTGRARRESVSTQEHTSTPGARGSEYESGSAGKFSSFLSDQPPQQRPQEIPAVTATPPATTEQPAVSVTRANPRLAQVAAVELVSPLIDSAIRPSMPSGQQLERRPAAPEAELSYRTGSSGYTSQHECHVSAVAISDTRVVTTTRRQSAAELRVRPKTAPAATVAPGAAHTAESDVLVERPGMGAALLEQLRTATHEHAARTTAPPEPQPATAATTVAPPVVQQVVYVQQPIMSRGNPPAFWQRSYRGCILLRVRR